MGPMLSPNRLWMAIQTIFFAKFHVIFETFDGKREQIGHDRPQMRNNGQTIAHAYEMPYGSPLGPKTTPKRV